MVIVITSPLTALTAIKITVLKTAVGYLLKYRAIISELMYA